MTRALCAVLVLVVLLTLLPALAGCGKKGPEEGRVGGETKQMPFEEGAKGAPGQDPGDLAAAQAREADPTGGAAANDAGK